MQAPSLGASAAERLQLGDALPQRITVQLLGRALLLQKGAHAPHHALHTSARLAFMLATFLCQAASPRNVRRMKAYAHARQCQY